MNVIHNTNPTKVNIFVILLFNLYLFGLVIGPGITHLFLLILFFIYIKNLNQNTLFLIDNFKVVMIIQLLLITYLVLNSLIVGHNLNLFYKSLFYFRFFLLAYVLSQFLDLNLETLKYVVLSILIFSIFLGIDIFYQYLTGYDVFGFEAGMCKYPGGEQNFNSANCERFSGFFGKELIAGGFLSTYGILASYLFLTKFNNFRFKNYLLILIFFIIISAIILSGERNALLTVMIIFIINVLFNKKIQKYTLIISISILLIFSILFSKVGRNHHPKPPSFL